ncbi:hypothetical protein ACJQWK_03555 [Exserohilum turcicum]
MVCHYSPCFCDSLLTRCVPSRYIPFRPLGLSEHADLFTETDEQKHNKHRRIVQPAYQMGNVLKNEAAIDQATTLLVERLRELIAKKEDVNLGHWIELYAYDVIGSVLFGRAYGFLESGTNVGSFIGSVDSAVPVLQLIAVTPSYMRGIIMLIAMCIPGMLKRLQAIQATTEEAKRQTELRMQRSAEENGNHHDIMSQLLRIVQDKGFKENFTHREVTLDAWVGIMAGSDSTAANMRAVLYYLMKNPRCMSAAVQEITQQEHLLSKPITYTESTNHLPYMSACIKEAQRLYSSIGISMPRVAPAPGIVLSNHYIPQGYVVGVNPHNAHVDTKLFGDDAKEFRPERWLESQARSFEMEKGMAFWGAGTRTCIGKNVALAEIHKLLPELLRQFDMRMAHDEPWKTRNAGFIKQSNVIVKLKERI